jgi:hypothetical protein
MFQTTNHIQAGGDVFSSDRVVLGIENFTFTDESAR